MSTGINRFVLCSAALHLGLLAVASALWTQPQLLPSALTVTLNAVSTATASSSRATTRAKAIASPDTPRALATFTDEAKTSGVQQIRASDDADASIAGTSSQAPGLLANAVSPSFEGEGMQSAMQQAATAQAQQNVAAAVESQLITQMRNALAPYFTYPLMARRNGWEGQVQVGLRVEADGRLSHVRIAHSSGYRTLDSAALTALNRVSTLPEAAGWLDGRHFDMVLPIEYRLIDGQS